MLPSLEGSNKEDSLLCLLDKRQWLKLLEEEPEQQWLLGISFMEHLKVLLRLVNNQLGLALELVEHRNIQMSVTGSLWIRL
jgi:hypothetical protein